MTVLKARRPRADKDKGPAIPLKRHHVGQLSAGRAADLLDFGHADVSRWGCVGDKAIARYRVIALPASKLLFRDVHAKGYLDIELVYRSRQKKSLGSVKQKIVRKIQRNESVFCFEDLVRETLDAV